ncbi:MAG TPA: nitroreductase/quinone reductase family protein [bacterium]|nr:nitroreductase/quinone reductase family protein [bacterium]
MASDAFLRALRRRKEISIAVRGRRSGRTITLPVWFVLEDRTLWLLPVAGSRSAWFRNLEAHPVLTLRAGVSRTTVRAEPRRGAALARHVADKFRAKYGREDVARYYERFDAAVKVSL